jgi:hypothetical protein
MGDPIAGSEEDSSYPGIKSELVMKSKDMVQEDDLFVFRCGFSLTRPLFGHVFQSSSGFIDREARTGATSWSPFGVMLRS